MNWKKDLSYLEAFWKGGVGLVAAYPEVVFAIVLLHIVWKIVAKLFF